MDPGVPIPPAVTAVHGFTDADVAGQPRFAAVAASLASIQADCDLAGFNIQRYELPLLSAEFGRAGVAFDPVGRAALDAQEIFFRRDAPGVVAVQYQLRGGALRRPRGAGGREGGGAGAGRCVGPVLGPAPGRGRLARPARRRRSDRPLPPGGRVVFAFGKHRGRPPAEIARQDPGYPSWLLRQPLLPDASEPPVSAFADAGRESQQNGLQDIIVFDTK